MQQQARGRQAGMLFVGVDGRSVTLVPPAELDLASETWLREALDRAEASQAADVVVDLSQVAFVDLRSTALLASSAARLSRAGRRLRLAGPSAGMRLAARLSGATHILKLAPGS